MYTNYTVYLWKPKNVSRKCRE